MKNRNFKAEIIPCYTLPWGHPTGLYGGKISVLFCSVLSFTPFILSMAQITHAVSTDNHTGSE